MVSKLNASSVITAGNMRMPVIGLGTWQSDPEEIDLALSTAIDAGYRHIDTAFLYGNEEAIGESLKKNFDSGKVKREDMFIVTKLPRIANRPQYVEHFLTKSLQNLKLDYIDLYLIHHPTGSICEENDINYFSSELDFEIDHIQLWKAMEEQVDAGRAKAIGVSNFNKRQLKRLLENSRISPANNQVELHIYLQQKDLVSFCKKNAVTICAFSPLGSPNWRGFFEKHNLSIEGSNMLKLLHDPIINEIANKYMKKPSHVLLRFLLQYGAAVIPKSVNPERIRDNFDVFDFSLTEEEFKQISDLDMGRKGRIFFMKEWLQHPEYPYNE